MPKEYYLFPPRRKVWVVRDNEGQWKSTNYGWTSNFESAKVYTSKGGARNSARHNRWRKEEDCHVIEFELKEIGKV